jgi:hypothetical protein
MPERKADASPSKRFFVEMLTRDIELDDAVLDLLDNCIDGVLRTTQGEAKNPDEPYSGFYAKISFDTKHFEVEDNCGGIPRKVAEDYAFRLGRPAPLETDAELPTVGVYGIGMKRAIFKLGRAATVRSEASDGSFEVKIPADWVTSPDWWFDIEDIAGGKKRGTRVSVTDLLPDIRKTFGPSTNFEADLRTKIASHYSVIISKGFRVDVNGKTVIPRKLQLLFTEGEEGLKPYVYEDTIDDVQVRLAVGFYQPIPSPDETEDDEDSSHRADDAGWTIICNDRVVIANDKSRLTGWGEASVPAYHNQFIAIAGVLEFEANSAEKLPLTTTKRGIDAGSDLYLRVKEQMRSGLKVFTSYTNKWKAHIDEQRKVEKAAKPVPVRAAVRGVPKDKWRQAKAGSTGRVFVPDLPQPKKDRADTVVRFYRAKKDIARVAQHLFDTADVPAGEVGAGCFDRILKEARAK